MRVAVAVVLSGALSAGLGAQRIARAAAQADLDTLRVVVHRHSAYSFRPDGQLYDGGGIVPDIVVPRTLDGVADGRDTQMAEALRFPLQRVSPSR